MSNIFDSHGRINGDIDPSEIPEARRAQFIALVTAQRGYVQNEPRSEEKNRERCGCRSGEGPRTARTPPCLVVRSWMSGNGWSVSNKKTAPPLSGGECGRPVRGSPKRTGHLSQMVGSAPDLGSRVAPVLCGTIGPIREPPLEHRRSTVTARPAPPA